jgi:AcrR family transcriptional regulator
MNWKNGEYQPKQQRADEKKRRLLDAGLELFSEL